MRAILLVVLAFAIAAAACGAPRGAAPERVTIAAYDGDVMEPFLSRDGRALFFNNRNDPPERTDLHWAERIDDLHFRYRGLVAGANGSALDAVATMSQDGRLCFVSTRSYFEALNTIYCGQWRDGALTNVAPQTQTSVHVLGRLMFDVEMSADGGALVLSDGLFRGGGAPARADLHFARWEDGEYVLAPELDARLRAVNSGALEYAAALSPDGLVLAFTRLRATLPMFANAEIWISRRADANAPFASPHRLRAITGFAEAATFTPDGHAIYFHKREDNRFTLWRLALAP